jgi:hypothetical protein
VRAAAQRGKKSQHTPVARLGVETMPSGLRVVAVVALLSAHALPAGNYQLVVHACEICDGTGTAFGKRCECGASTVVPK